jgi:hypothetical protein
MTSVRHSLRIVASAALAIAMAGCSSAGESLLAQTTQTPPAAPLQRAAPSVAVDSTALAERVGLVTAQADRCGLTIDLERNKRMLAQFETRVGRSNPQVDAAMAVFESAFARGLAAGCPGRSARLAEDLILIEDGQFNALMAR